MSNWFHRNPFKATSKVTFDMGPVAKSIQARSICSELGSKRANLLKLLANPSSTSDSVLDTANQYFPLLLGFIDLPESAAPNNAPPSSDQDDQTSLPTPSSASKLRGFVRFKWSNSICPKSQAPEEQADAEYELCSMLYMIATWYAKHAAKISAQESVQTADAVETYKSLRNAAGIFKMIKDQYVDKLIVKPSKGTDLDGDALQACISQFTAEAQEVAFARAIEGKQKPDLIAGLGFETAQAFDKAGLALDLYDVKVIGKWRTYFQFKSACYKAYALVYHSEALLVQEKAGEGLGMIDRAEEHFKIAERLGQAYGRSHGIGLSSRIAEHAFFRRLGPLIQRTRTKIADQAMLIYRQKKLAVGADPVLKASHGLVDPTPPHLTLLMDDRWKEGYAGFDEKKLTEAILYREKKAKESKKPSDRDAPVEQMSEPPIYQTDKDPKNESGCVVS